MDYQFKYSRVCPECNGYGGWRSGRDWCICHRCNGNCYIEIESGSSTATELIVYDNGVATKYHSNEYNEK